MMKKERSINELEKLLNEKEEPAADPKEEARVWFILDDENKIKLHRGKPWKVTNSTLIQMADSAAYGNRGWYAAKAGSKWLPVATVVAQLKQATAEKEPAADPKEEARVWFILDDENKIRSKGGKPKKYTNSQLIRIAEFKEADQRTGWYAAKAGGKWLPLDTVVAQLKQATAEKEPATVVGLNPDAGGRIGSLMARQKSDQRRYGKFMKKPRRGIRTQARTDRGRLKDSQAAIARIAGMMGRAPTIIDIGSGLGNPNPRLAGVTVKELMDDGAIRGTGAKIIATDIPGQMERWRKLKGGYDLTVEEIPANFNWNVDELASRHDDGKAPIILRAANGIDLLMNPGQMMTHMSTIARDAQKRPVVYIFNNMVLYKAPNTTEFKPVGNIHNRGYDHGGPGWRKPLRKNETQFKVDETFADKVKKDTAKEGEGPEAKAEPEAEAVSPEIETQFDDCFDALDKKHRVEVSRIIGAAKGVTGTNIGQHKEGGAKKECLKDKECRDAILAKCKETKVLTTTKCKYGDCEEGKDCHEATKTFKFRPETEWKCIKKCCTPIDEGGEQEEEEEEEEQVDDEPEKATGPEGGEQPPAPEQEPDAQVSQDFRCKEVSKLNLAVGNKRLNVSRGPLYRRISVPLVRPTQELTVKYLNDRKKLVAALDLFQTAPLALGTGLDNRYGFRNHNAAVKIIDDILGIIGDIKKNCGKAAPPADVLESRHYKLNQKLLKNFNLQKQTINEAIKVDCKGCCIDEIERLARALKPIFDGIQDQDPGPRSMGKTPNIKIKAARIQDFHNLLLLVDLDCLFRLMKTVTPPPAGGGEPSVPPEPKPVPKKQEKPVARNVGACFSERYRSFVQLFVSPQDIFKGAGGISWDNFYNKLLRGGIFRVQHQDFTFDRGSIGYMAAQVGIFSYIDDRKGESGNIQCLRVYLENLRRMLARLIGNYDEKTASRDVKAMYGGPNSTAQQAHDALRAAVKHISHLIDNAGKYARTGNKGKAPVAGDKRAKVKPPTPKEKKAAVDAGIDALNKRGRTIRPAGKAQKLAGILSAAKAGDKMTLVFKKAVVATKKANCTALSVWGCVDKGIASTPPDPLKFIDVTFSSDPSVFDIEIFAMGVSYAGTVQGDGSIVIQTNHGVKKLTKGGMLAALGDRDPCGGAGALNCRNSKIKTGGKPAASIDNLLKESKDPQQKRLDLLNEALFKKLVK